VQYVAMATLAAGDKLDDERMVKLGAPADELCKRNEEDHQRLKALAAMLNT
jgi:hypothetical protein